jgi:hypothetical protein
MHTAKCAVKYSLLTIILLYKPEYISHIPHDNQANQLLIVIRREEKYSFIISAITTTGAELYTA